MTEKVRWPKITYAREQDYHAAIDTYRAREDVQRIAKEVLVELRSLESEKSRTAFLKTIDRIKEKLEAFSCG